MNLAFHYNVPIFNNGDDIEDIHLTRNNIY